MLSRISSGNRLFRFIITRRIVSVRRELRLSGLFHQRIIVRGGHALLFTQLTQFFLQLGNLVITQLQQLFAGGVLRFQIAQPGFQFGIFTVQTIQALIANRQFVLKHRRIRATLLVRTSAVAIIHTGSGFRSHQFHFTTGWCLSLIIAVSHLARTINLGTLRGLDATLFQHVTPLAVLVCHFHNGGTGRDVAHFLLVRNTQNRALTHQVHVVVDEGIRIHFLNRHQHLLHRYTV